MLDSDYRRKVELITKHNPDDISRMTITEINSRMAWGSECLAEIWLKCMWVKLTRFFRQAFFSMLLADFFYVVGYAWYLLVTEVGGVLLISVSTLISACLFIFFSLKVANLLEKRSKKEDKRLEELARAKTELRARIKLLEQEHNRRA